jgi:benzoyl-CoA reductase/2-hydroxyglutaryl-CoA dehydratase subunit BcrC/BadD/HgdB
VARSVLELELLGIAKMVKAYAFTSLCDTLINLREIYRRLFPKPTIELSIPITQTVNARQTYLNRVIQDVTSALEALTGQKISRDSLKEAAQLCGRTRALQRKLYKIRRNNPGLIKNHDFYTALKAGFFLPANVYNNLLDNLLTALNKLKSPDLRGPKLLLSGMVFDPIEVYAIFDELGANIVDDDFANGWRTVAKEDLQVANRVAGITNYLFKPAPCCCIYNPDNDRHLYLIDKVKRSGADGVLFWYIKFCEPDAFDRPQLINRLKEEGIAAAYVDVELTMTNFDAVKTRISAFCEILENR